MTKLSAALTLAALIPGAAQATELPYLTAASRLMPETKLVLVYRNGAAVPARLIALDTTARVLQVTTTGDRATELRTASFRELKEIQYQQGGKVKPLFMLLGLVGGAAMGAVIGNAVDPPDPHEWLDFGGGPAGLVIGAAAGLAIGIALPASLPKTGHIAIPQEPRPGEAARLESRRPGVSD